MTVTDVFTNNTWSLIELYFSRIPEPTYYSRFMLYVDGVQKIADTLLGIPGQAVMNNMTFNIQIGFSACALEARQFYIMKGGFRMNAETQANCNFSVGVTNSICLNCLAGFNRLTPIALGSTTCGVFCPTGTYPFFTLSNCDSKFLNMKDQ